MKLYHGPGSCSTGIHVLMNELGVPFEEQAISLRSGEQNSPEFQGVSAKGKVPTLVRDDGSVLTEFQTIAYWLASAHPEAGLLSTDLETRTRTLEVLDYMVASVHMRGFTFMFATGKFLSDPEGQAALKAHGRSIVDEGLEKLDAMLGDKPYLMGDFSIADCGLFYICQFAHRGSVDLPPNLAAFHARMLERPAVIKTLAAEA